MTIENKDYKNKNNKVNYFNKFLGTFKENLFDYWKSHLSPTRIKIDAFVLAREIDFEYRDTCLPRFHTDSLSTLSTRVRGFEETRLVDHPLDRLIPFKPANRAALALPLKLNRLVVNRKRMATWPLKISVSCRRWDPYEGLWRAQTGSHPFPILRLNGSRDLIRNRNFDCTA